MENLFKISLIISTAGILFLLLLSNAIEPKPIKIKDINNELIDKKVKIQGQIFNIKSYEGSNFQVLSVKDNTSKIDVILGKPINMTINKSIIIIGRVQEYKSYLQISADKITS